MSARTAGYLSALAPWYGGKRTLAPRIVAELGRHSFYVEPFCGSMAVLLSKKRAPMETVNELHGDLINLARVLASEHAVDLYARAARLLMHEGLHAEFKALCTGSPCPVAPSVAAVEPAHVERALAYLVMSWQGRNGSAGTSPTNLTVARRFTSNGGSGGLRWASAVESIPVWHERLRTVAILNMDAFELVERIEDADGTAMYLDPPYVEKSDSYSHDLADADHDRLAEVLRQKKRMRCVVSYYDCDRVRDLYRGWTFVLCPLNKATSHQGRRGKVQTTAPEVLIINGPSLTAEALFAHAENTDTCDTREITS